MSIWGAFTNSVTAMNAQSTALSHISQNIANVNTTGYKRSESLFATVLSESTAGTDVFGTKPNIRTLVDRQGQMRTSNYWSDLAVNGEGFFVVNTMPDGSGETFYTRQGSFSTAIDPAVAGRGQTTYLVDGNGYYLQGWGAGASGAGAAGLTGINFDRNAELPGTATTTATLNGNIDAGGGTQTSPIHVYDTGFQSRRVDMTFTPTGNANEWTVTYAPENGASASSHTVTFGGGGALVSPTSATLDVTWADGSTSAVALDMSRLTSLSGATRLAAEVDGSSSGSLIGLSFAGNGELVASYSNARSVALGQLALARFEVPNALGQQSGSLFYATEGAGLLELSRVGTDWNSTTFVGGALEASNVDVADEFTRMIATQKAYSSASRVFQVADEMMTTAGGLKR